MQYIITIIFVIFDFLSGWVASICNGNFKSSVMRKGIFHKLAIFGVLFLVALLDWATNFVNLGVLAEFPVSGTICTGFVVMEVQSVMENLHRMNEDIPGSITELLKVSTVAKEEKNHAELR